MTDNPQLMVELAAIKMLLVKVTAAQAARLSKRDGKTDPALMAANLETLLAAGERDIDRMAWGPTLDRTAMRERTKAAYAALIDAVALGEVATKKPLPSREA